MPADARTTGAVVAALLATVVASCAAPSATTPSGGFNGTYACTGTTTTPAGSSYGTGTFGCLDGHCADSSGAFSGTVDANGNFQGTDVICPTCVPLPMTGHMSTTDPFTISGASGGVSATFACQCSGTCGGGSPGGGGGPPPPAITSVSPAIVDPGVQVQIVGDDFPLSTAGLTVTICGIDAQVVATGLHAIIVVMPTVSPGTCDVVVTCPAGSSTLAGAVTVLEPYETIASGLSYPNALALDATHAYWLETDGTLKRVAKAGGTVETLAAGLSSPVDLAVDGTSVYWTESGKVRKVPKGGGTVVDLVTGLSFVAGIAVDPAGVYWAGHGFFTVGLDGGTPVTLAPFDDASDPGRDVAVRDGTLYFATVKRVRKVPVAGGTPEIIFAGAMVNFLAVDATTAYWVQYAVDDFRVRSVPLTGGSATEIYSRAWNLAVDPTGVYLTVKDGGRLMRVSHDGSTTTTLAQALLGPWGVATDDTHVYWTEGGAVRRLAK